MDYDMLVSKHSKRMAEIIKEMSLLKEKISVA
jgi:hypothetical protein